MIWKVWTVSLCGRVVMTVRLDAVGWPVEEQELQRARAAAAAAPAHAQPALADARVRAPAAAVGRGAPTVEELTDWFGTQSRIRAPRKVAEAVLRRGLSAEEAADVWQWLDSQARPNTAEPDAIPLSDSTAEQAWIERRGRT